MTELYLGTRKWAKVDGRCSDCAYGTGHDGHRLLCPLPFSDTILRMLPQLAEIFLNVIAPVFGLGLMGYMAGPQLQLDARTLPRLLNLPNDLVFLYTLSLS